MAIAGVALFALLVVLAQQVVYRRFWSSSLGLRMFFSTSQAFEGESAVLTEELTNAKPLPLPWVVARFQVSRNLVFPGQANARVSDSYYQSDMFSVGMYQRITRRLPFICWRRGCYRLKGVSLSSSNLLISHRLVKELACEEELTVFPRLIDGPELEVLCRQVGGDILVRRFTNPDPFAFRGIREYQAGDSLRAVNHKATARQGELMVNLYSATASRELVIVLNLTPYADWDLEDVYEEGIRLAASLAARFLEQGLSVELYANGRDISSGAPLHVRPGSGPLHLESMLRGLARIDLGQEPEPLCGLLDSLRDPLPAYLLVSSYDKEDWRRAFLRMRGDGLDAKWILPALADTRIAAEENEDVIRWEVKPYDSAAYLRKEAAG